VSRLEYPRLRSRAAARYVRFGSIYGWLYAVFMLGTAVGPLLTGAAFDHFKNYQIATLGLGTSLAIAAILTWRLPSFAIAPSPSNHSRESA
jgi:MFS family permease